MLQIHFNTHRVIPARLVRSGTITVGLLLFSVLSACQDGVFKPAAEMRTPQSAYPITVAPQTETLLLPPHPIGDANAARIGAFASDFMRHGHGPLIIESATSKISKPTFEQIKAVNAILAERGVPVARLEWRTAKNAPGAEPKAAANQLTLSYTRYTATSTPCSGWSKDTGSTHDNQPTANFGCATQHNLAVMIADPLDLKRPRGTDPADAIRRATVVDKYRAGEATASPRSADERGTVSEVSQ